MLKSTYDTINGIPACIIIDDTNSSNQQYTENDFIYGENSGSKLHQYGYNVNNQDKLTEEQPYFFTVYKNIPSMVLHSRRLYLLYFLRLIIQCYKIICFCFIFKSHVNKSVFVHDIHLIR